VQPTQSVSDVKTCAQCGATLPVAEFHRFVHAKDGRTPWCKPCVSRRNREYREKHRDAVLAGKKAAYRRDPETNRARNAAWKARNPERHEYLVRRSWLKQMYGMSPEDYDALLEAQGHACAICRKAVGQRRLAIDHDHGCCPGKRSCGQCVRGLLCTHCNRLLGWLDNRRAVIGAYIAAYETRRDQ
jgi:hypothetical protein